MMEAETSPWKLGVGSVPLVRLSYNIQAKKLMVRAETHAVRTYYSLKSKIKRDFGDKPSIMCLLEF